MSRTLQEKYLTTYCIFSPFVQEILNYYLNCNLGATAHNSQGLVLILAQALFLKVLEEAFGLLKIEPNLAA